jgi:hypothetical protein
MVASLDTVAFAVRSLVRLGAAARQTYDQAVRDAPIKIADLPLPAIDDDEALWGFFETSEFFGRIEQGGDLAPLWMNDKGVMRPRDKEARQMLVAEQLKILEQIPPTPGENWIAERFSQQGASTILVHQWKSGTGPPTPATRLVLAFADVALDYVGSNPGILGVGGNGEKLISALSQNFRALLPDVDDREAWKNKGAKYFFVERALAITLHAGLKTIGENISLVVEQEHYQKLLQNVLAPLIKQLDDHPDSLPEWIDIRDTLLGPVAEAALKTLHDNQTAFLGGRFDPNEAAGAVTSALLQEAARGPLMESFGTDGLVRLYKAALGVAIKSPALFVDKQGPRADLAKELLVGIAGALQVSPPGFNEKLSTEIAVNVLDALANNAPSLLRLKDGAWSGVAGDLVRSILGGLKDGLAKGGPSEAFTNLFSSEETLKLISAIIQRVAKTPGLIGLPAANAEVQALVGALTVGLGQKGAVMLSAGDWIAIAEAAAAEVARNPLRLLKLGAKPEEQLLASVLQALLEKAAPAAADGKGRSGNVLFGDTLREAVVAAVIATAGNSVNASKNLGNLRDFVAVLNGLATDEAVRLGANEWLSLFKANVGSVLHSGAAAGLTPAKLLAGLGR